MASSPNKTVQAEPLVMQLISAGTGVTKSAVIDVTTKFSGTVFWDFAPTENTAGASTQLSIQASQKASGDTAWVTVQDWVSPTVLGGTATCTATAGASTLLSTATMGAMQKMFIYEAGAIATSEFHTRVTVGAPNFTVGLEDLLANNHGAGTPLLIGAERFSIPVDFSGFVRVRFCIYNANGATNRPVVCRIALTTVDSIG
jgi:hypothetical protein